VPDAAIRPPPNSISESSILTRAGRVNAGLQKNVIPSPGDAGLFAMKPTAIPDSSRRSGRQGLDPRPKHFPPRIRKSLPFTRTSARA